MMNNYQNSGHLRFKSTVLTCLVIPLLVVLAGCSIVQTQQSASDKTLHDSKNLIVQRNKLERKVERLLEAGARNDAIAELEAYLDKYPFDLISGNLYRRVAVENNVHDWPIRFFSGQINKAEKAEKEQGIRVPSGLRYNMAFTYIDKIPVVGPMGAGFLSKRSIAQFEIALEEDPLDWIANYGIGMNYLHWPDYFEKNDTSIDYFRACIEIQEQRELRPSDMLAYIRLGDAYAKDGHLDLAFDAWNQGVDRFGRHPDLVERLEIEPDRLTQSIVEAYNPNNSIGAIDTDISILWADHLPDSVFPLRQMAQHGQSGQLRLSESGDLAGTNLFSWFRANLPSLLRRESSELLDMTGIGVEGSGIAGLIAHNMIIGFMSQMHDDPLQLVEEKLGEILEYEKPFYHEGIGMGLAAALDLGDASEFEAFGTIIEQYDPHYRRLHYAGLGMWFGMQPTVNLVRVRSRLQHLDLGGQFYAYEGLGFAVFLFSQDSSSRELELVRRLPFQAASTFAHGAGRALWIKYGQDQRAVTYAISQFQSSLHSDAWSGFGMGVAFAGIESPEQIVDWARRIAEESAESCTAFKIGVAMGLNIRYQGSPQYLRSQLRKISSPYGRSVVPQLLQAGSEALLAVENTGAGDLHRNWRVLIQEAIERQIVSGSTENLCKEVI